MKILTVEEAHQYNDLCDQTHKLFEERTVLRQQIAEIDEKVEKLLEQRRRLLET